MLTLKNKVYSIIEYYSKNDYTRAICHYHMSEILKSKEKLSKSDFVEIKALFRIQKQRPVTLCKFLNLLKP